MDKRLANRRVIEALIRAGAFDTIAPGSPEPDRATLFASVALAIEAADQAAANALQTGLFDMPGEESGPMVDYARAKPWAEREKAQGRKGRHRLLPVGPPF